MSDIYMEVFPPNLKKGVACCSTADKTKICFCQWSLVPRKASNLELYPMGQRFCVYFYHYIITDLDLTPGIII